MPSSSLPGTPLRRSHIQISRGGNAPVKGTRRYHEGASALRDMVQNHLPSSFVSSRWKLPTGSGPLQHRVKEGQDSAIASPHDAGGDRLEYRARSICRGRDIKREKRVPVIGAEKGVNRIPRLRPSSPCVCWSMTGAWLTCHYIRVGKRLRGNQGTEISVHFKKAPPVLFNKESVSLDQNVPRDPHSAR